MENQAKQILIRIAATGLIAGAAFAIGYQQGSSKSEDREIEQSPEIPETTEVATLAEKPEVPETSTPIESPQREEPTPTRSPQESGFEAAAADIESALRQIETLNGREQIQYTRGVFEYLASVQTPELSLELANLQEPRTRSIALRALVAAWSTPNGLSSQEAQARADQIFGRRGSPVGTEAALSSYLSADNVPQSVKDSWIQTFSQHPGRSEIRARMAAGGSPEEIQAALAESQNWTEWERRNFSESLLFQWTQKAPAEAWKWYQNSGDKLEESQADLIIQTWASRNPDRLLEQLDQIDLGPQRETAIQSLSRSLARRGTLDAMNWADSLADPAERDIAYQSIYDATPKGIGAKVGIESGFLRVDQIMPEGALRNTDVQAGDLIVEARELDGGSHSLYGKSLRESIGALRGAPGSQVEIRYLRRNPDTGEMEERTTTVTRDILVNDG
ncbi:hypothetical protein [Pelagicoccus mobilis]|uniref:PDZ domain-containing protein n=1 Tax=Pelagicoccus mobilis TaxID=415221 RepID=A0A934RW29_9BACT|nr:hypothetical protein [Pelagicoccus mobilis]MBK1876224.1 hypothetical protein [Pelagicoccus mobilis]